MASDETTERDGLDMKIRSTLEWHFGQACDQVETVCVAGKVDRRTAEVIKSRIRTEGNLALRVIYNHLEKVNVSRKHSEEPINKARVIRKVSTIVENG